MKKIIILIMIGNLVIAQNKDLLGMTIRNYDGACASASRGDHNSSIQLWKLQRK